MRIGVMLRHLDEHPGGVIVYTRHLLQELLKLDTAHEFVLIFRNRASAVEFQGRRADRSVVARTPFKIAWDQWAIRRVVRSERLDLVFNPKYSVPLGIDCPSVFVCHGMDWYLMPWASRWLDRMSHRFLFPRYARAATRILSVSGTARDHLIQYLNIEPDKVATVHLGVHERFRRPLSSQAKERARSAWNLPDRYFLYVGQIYPPKNFGRLLEAYAQAGPPRGIPLVVAGQHAWLCDDELALVERLGIGEWVVWKRWIEHESLPPLYAMAEALVLPSLYDSFGLPLVEAMASGCPVITADRFGPAEVTGEAGILVDPYDVAGLASAMIFVASHPDARRRLAELGRERSQAFTWARCARKTLRQLEVAGLGRRASHEGGKPDLEPAVAPDLGSAAAPGNPRPEEVPPRAARGRSPELRARPEGGEGTGKTRPEEPRSPLGELGALS
ncbi:MAG: glycosyltransferase family 4 protein [Gemmatimonadota bacterium]